MRKLFFNLAIFIASTAGWAQPMVEKEYHLMRADDYLFKQQVEFIYPGEEGENIFWDFSQLKVIDDKYRVSCMEIPDSLLLLREVRSLYKYALRNDSLVKMGIEDKSLLLNYLRPELQLIYPVSYNDRNEDYFYATGDYCKNIDLVLSGKAAYHADAYGTIFLPDGDTLNHVLRVKHTVKELEDQYPYETLSTHPVSFSTDDIDTRLANDSIRTETDIYRWYAKGYRYPVFESILYYLCSNGTKVLQAATSFYYPAHEQYYGLDDDPSNREERERMAMAKESGEWRKAVLKDRTTNAEEKNNTFVYKILPDKEAAILKVDYKVESATQVGLVLTDMAGRVLIQLGKEWKEPGNYQEKLLLSRHFREEYILQIITDEKTYIEKIIN